MILNPGDLKERVTLQSKTVTTDVLGQEVAAWVEFATVWAQVKEPSSRDVFMAGQHQVIVDRVITLRFLAGVNSLMRVVWNGEPWEIVGEPWVVEGRNRYITIKLTKGIRDGK